MVRITIDFNRIRSSLDVSFQLEIHRTRQVSEHPRQSFIRTLRRILTTLTQSRNRMGDIIVDNVREILDLSDSGPIESSLQATSKLPRGVESDAISEPSGMGHFTFLMCGIDTPASCTSFSTSCVQSIVLIMRPVSSLDSLMTKLIELSLTGILVA